MELITLLTQQWKVVAAAPTVLITAIAVSAGFGFAAARMLYSNVVEAARERQAAAQDEVGRLRGDQQGLLDKLASYGEDVERVRLDLARIPKFSYGEDVETQLSPDHAPTFHVGREEPVNPRDGDVWIQPGGPAT